MEFLETFQKIDDYLKNLKDSKYKCKVIFTGIILYTTIISIFTFFGTSFLFSVVNFNASQKTALICVIAGCLYFIFSKIDWNFLSSLFQSLKKIFGLFSGSEINAGTMFTKFLSINNKNISNGDNSDQKVQEIGDSLCISYLFRGTIHKIFVPYNRNNMNKYIGYKVIAEYTKDGNTEDVDITQQSGIDYLISPDDINALRIYSIDSEKNILFEVQGDQKFVAKQKIIYDE